MWFECVSDSEGKMIMLEGCRMEERKKRKREVRERDTG